MRARIGVFDSGVGGLTVLRRLLERLPNAEYHYLGDTARVPYGIRSADTIVEYSREGLSYLRGLGVDLLVVACNTSSAIAVPSLHDEFSHPLIGVVNDGVEIASDLAQRGALVLGTRATIMADIYQRQIAQRRPALPVRGLACPLFVPIVEEGWADSQVAVDVARRYLDQCSDFSFDLVLLGCTHFPIMQATLERAVGQDVRVVDPSVRVASRVAGCLPSAASGGCPEVHFHVTDSPEGFTRVARAMGMPIHNEVKHVDVAALLS
ncbi:glutamate racemase [Pseudomarimonas arenosa]|uniref:Glutamate racemase n=1 Tax=Pseudomarimonas arenosa TaxID=2774145 RepID=A0AAW3ZHG2_9GAMM|nr:glutamate racemase [Pseudomarimonas arenosa]MBD8524189.1 glutamate racemase [Pseudomarimonas arenosa]